MIDKPVALVTGATRGIGLQIARELAEGGHLVLLGCRNAEDGAAAARDIGSDAHPIRLDVTDREGIAAAATRIEEQFGRLEEAPRFELVETRPLGGDILHRWTRALR